MATADAEEDGFFKHQPLNLSDREIRVLEVDADLSHDGLIQCRLRHTKLGSTHTCLSYTWGDPTWSQLILINGKKFQVRRNLWDFLGSTRFRRNTWVDKPCGCSDACRSLHREMKDSISDGLWIDAICIDQSNLPERNQQVRLMGDIYQQATQVQVYLGSGGPDVDKALGRIDMFFRSPFDSYTTGYDISRMCRNFGWDADQHQSVLKVMNYPYWVRVWTRQEIYLAKHARILCGNHQFEADRFMLVLRSLAGGYSSAMERSLIKQPTATKYPLRDLICGFGARNGAETMWCNGSWSLECTEKKDRIYAMLSMASDGNLVEVDYSTPVVELFFRVFTLPQAADKQSESFDWIALGWKLAVGLDVSANELMEAVTRPAVRGLDLGGWARSIAVTEVAIVGQAPQMSKQMIPVESPRELRVPIDLSKVFRDDPLPAECQTRDVIFAVSVGKDVNEFRTIFFVGRREERQPGKLRIVACGHYVEAFRGYSGSQYLNGGMPGEMLSSIHERRVFEVIPHEAEIFVTLDKGTIEPKQNFSRVAGMVNRTTVDARESGLEGQLNFTMREAITIIGATMRIYHTSGRPIPMKLFGRKKIIIDQGDRPNRDIVLRLNPPDRHPVLKSRPRDANAAIRYFHRLFRRARDNGSDSSTSYTK